MTNHTHNRPRPSSAHTTHATPKTASTPAPGTAVLHALLGADGYQRLDRHRCEHGTPLGELADLVWNTAREADRLHKKLRRHASHLRDHLDETTGLRLASASVTGLLHNAGHATETHAARFAQQMNHLIAVLESYLAAGGTRTVTDRS